MISIVGWKNEGVKGLAIIEADNFAEACNTDSKRKAIEEGTKHLGLCGISGSSGPYPVDEDGKEVTDLTLLSAMFKDKKPVKYRNDYNISQSLAL